MPDFYLKRNDTKEPIQATLSDQAGAVDLTGATVRFHMKNRAGTVVVDAPAEVVTPAGGVVRYQWQAEDTAAAGDFYAEWEVTFPSGAVQTFPNENDIGIRIAADVA